MSPRVPRLLAVLSIAIAATCAAGQTIDSSQLPALADLQAAFGLNYSSWGEGGDCYKASFLRCDSDGMITEINLGASGLLGSLPESISGLVNLTSIDLSANGLTGPIPSTIGALAKLKRMQLDKNTFEGNLPLSLGRLTNLTSLDLAANHFTGSIPAELGNLVNLQYLQLNDNYFAGSIPASFSQLDQLQWLQLGNNQLSGQLPAGFVAFPGLTGLWVDIQHTCPPDSTGCGQTRPFRNNTFCLQTCPSFCDTCIPRKLPTPPPNTTTTIGTSFGTRVNATGAPVALPPPSSLAVASTPKGASGDAIRCSSILVLGLALALLALL
ncbi:unnamed protein product [Closterium sp. NIES-53]